ncbi:NosR/NirI family protein [Marinobacter caseinilyticus]|uniref:NosR/NirI family protein n=1 Tax=Marinobacter caseinilyticus TaxID=2692195 RepID=UPI00140925DC|nr:NosR/NirI family protein [Marinobacter caseinilyticus]
MNVVSANAVFLALLMAILWLPPVHADINEHHQALIQQLFPKATRIEDKLSDYPVYPVYQLNQLLGYAYESSDISDLTGYSGRPINLMIGIDADGHFAGVHVLDHHEPVFLHGLGEEPLFEFVGQYAGRSLTEHIVVNSKKAGTDSGGDGGVVYFDGVTSATISVIIINDSVLSSALKVARNKLEAFAQAPAARPKPDFYQPLTWQQMLDQGYVGHWRVSVTEAEALIGNGLDRYPAVPEPGPEEAFTDIYYAYASAPIVGRNLLGDASYERLVSNMKKGEQMLAVMSRGLFTHVPDDFRPGTVPGELLLEQSDLVVELRDMNRLDADTRLIAGGVPDFAKAHLFKMGGSGGFNPGADAQLVLSLALPRNHLVVDRLSLRSPLALPQDMFELVAPPKEQYRQPAWIGLWLDRWLQITMLVISLVVLTVFFSRQAYFSRYPKRVHRFRWGFLFFTVFFIGFYAQGQLSVVNIFTVLLSLWDGFDIAVFLLDPVIFILWLYTFVSLFIWGRGLFCGWLCPFGALQEMASWLAKKLNIKQRRVPEAWHRRLISLKYLILLGLVGTSFYSLTLAEQLAEVEPFKTSITLFFWRYWPFVLYAVGLLVASMFVHKFFCRYLCPLGAGLAVLGRLRLFSWLERVKLCGSPCQLCKRRCEINAIRTDGRIDYDECIQCLECVVILRDDSQCVDKVIAQKRSNRGEILAVNVG